MRFAFLVLPAAVLAGCATGSQIQAQCEARFERFADMYRCTASEIAKTAPSITNDARAKLYLLRGEQLAEQVERGQISNIDAKVAWQQLFVELKSASARDIANALQAMPRPVPTTRSPAVTCNSQVIGSSIATNCQ
jgi:hypothetical protein